MTPTELIVKCYAVQLLSRRAQLSSWLKYYLIVGKVTLCHGKDRQSTGRTFDETMPLIPAWAGIPAAYRKDVKKIFTGFSNSFNHKPSPGFYEKQGQR